MSKYISRKELQEIKRHAKRLEKQIICSDKSYYELSNTILEQTKTILRLVEYVRILQEIVEKDPLYIALCQAEITVYKPKGVKKLINDTLSDYDEP